MKKFSLTQNIAVSAGLIVTSAASMAAGTGPDVTAIVDQIGLAGVAGGSVAGAVLLAYAGLKAFSFARTALGR